MALGSLFREEAIEHQSAREPIDRVAQVTVPYDWIVLILLAVVCVLAVLWAAFVKIELSLPIDVMVVKQTDDRAIVSPVSARVGDVLVDVGTQVAVGDELVRVEVPELHRRRTEAEERERIIREELGQKDSDDSELSRMLVESRVESAALTIAIEQDEVISSQYAGEVVEINVAVGQVAVLGQEVMRVRVGDSTATFAIASVPQSRIDTLTSDTEVLIRCPGPDGVETLSARALIDSTQNNGESNLGLSADFDPEGHQVSLVLPDSVTITNGTRCEGYVPLGRHTPLRILLGASGGTE